LLARFPHRSKKDCKNILFARLRGIRARPLLVATFISQCLVGPLVTIAFSLVYYDERVRKEAFDLQLMMDTLDAPAL
jgi:hypothetical protein